METGDSDALIKESGKSLRRSERCPDFLMGRLAIAEVIHSDLVECGRARVGVLITMIDSPQHDTLKQNRIM